MFTSTSKRERGLKICSRIDGVTAKHFCINHVKGGWHNEAMRDENMGMHPPFAQTFEEGVCSLSWLSKLLLSLPEKTKNAMRGIFKVRDKIKNVRHLIRPWEQGHNAKRL